MKTFNRKPYEIDTTLKNISKYNNQLTFTGIKQSKNIYEVDQKSQMDTLNVYVNDENTLVSREPLVEDELDIELDGELIDIKETNSVKAYVIKNESGYKIIAKRDDKTAELTATEYHLAIFNQYIICFRTEGAQVIDTNQDNLLWKDIEEYVEVPILRQITGADVEDLTINTNQLTNRYKEHYLIKEDIRTILPELVPTKIEIESNNERYSLENFNRPYILTNERLIRKCHGYYNENLEPIDITYHNNIVCINENSNFMLSFDYGDTFIKVTYPFNNEDKVFPAQLSEDGRVVFVVVKQGVWVCKIGDEYIWELINIRNDQNLSLDDTFYRYEYRILLTKFVNSEMFMFVQIFDTDTLKPRLYFKGTNLYSEKQYEDMLDYIELDGLPIDVHTSITSAGVLNHYYGMRQCSTIKYDVNTNSTVGAITCGNDSKQFVIFFANWTDGIVSKIISYDKAYARGSFTIYDSSLKIDSDNYNIKRFEIYGIDNRVSDNMDTCKYKITISAYFEIPEPMFEIIETLPYYRGELIKINQNAFIGMFNYLYEADYIVNNEGHSLPRLSSNIETNNVDYYIPMDNSDTIYYLSDKGVILTNNLGTDTAIFEYELTDTKSETVKNKIPSVTYSGSELFLGFNNELMITDNSKDGSQTLFNLPKINNQSFTDTITNIINISTSEIALFFENNIIICNKVDTDIGEAYAYNKTRLSLGVRLGDDVINTLDGANSMFPTTRGLAIMNYQAYMATTDQILNFATDNIYELWIDFYKKSSSIKIIQMRNYIYLSNGTNEYLMFDVRTASWWKFRIPFAITKMLTNQLQLNIISSKLYKIDNEFNGDKYLDCDTDRIDWYIISQRLHFGAINHYKNLKQLIFQLVQSNNYENTVDTEIKLYRKVVSYKEPETIKFKIDEYRTFVKRFNYWKINELQWCLSNDDNTATPAQLILNGIDIKYEIGEEVR